MLRQWRKEVSTEVMSSRVAQEDASILAQLDENLRHLHSFIDGYIQQAENDVIATFLSDRSKKKGVELMEKVKMLKDAWCTEPNDKGAAKSRMAINSKAWSAKKDSRSKQDETTGITRSSFPSLNNAGN